MLIAILVAALCWRALRSGPNADEALVICLLAGLVLSPHAYAYDCMLALPAILFALSPFDGRPVCQVMSAGAPTACPLLLWCPAGRLIPQIALPAFLLWLCVRPKPGWRVSPTEGIDIGRRNPVTMSARVSSRGCTARYPQ